VGHQITVSVKFLIAVEILVV